jgi:transcription antitermination factor NusG
MTPMIGVGMTFKPGDRVRVMTPEGGVVEHVSDSLKYARVKLDESGRVILVAWERLILADSTEGGEKA